MNRIKVLALIVSVSFIIYGTVKGQAPLYVKHAGNSIIIPETIKNERLKIDKETRGAVSTRRPHRGYVSLHIPSNMVFVAYERFSSRPGRIEIYDLDLNEKGILDAKTTPYRMPVGVVSRRDGNFLITGKSPYKVMWFDNNAHKLTEIPIHPAGLCSPAVFNQKGNAVVFQAENEKLFSVYNSKGERIAQFGELLESSSRNPGKRHDFWNKNFNMLYYTVDEKGYLFCAFSENPVFRIYDPDGNLVCEADYWNIPGIKDYYENWLFKNKETVEKRIKAGNTGFKSKTFISQISVDERFIYIKYNISLSPIYAFDKTNFSLVKTVELENGHDHGPFDATSRDYIYKSLDIGILARYKKIK